MRRQASILMIFLTAVLLTGRAYAGPVHGPGVGGGGDVILCLKGSTEVAYFADTFFLTPSNPNDIYASFDDPTTEALLQIVDEILPQKNINHPYSPGKKVSLSWMLSRTMHLLNFYRNDTGVVEELDDDYIDESKLPAGCRKKQLAIQDVGLLRVELDDIFYQLSTIEKSLFKLHEAKIALRGRPRVDTTPIRHQIAELIDQNKISLAEVLKRLRRPPAPSILAVQDLSERERPPKILKKLQSLPAQLECRLGGQDKAISFWHPRPFTVASASDERKSQNKSETFEITSQPLKEGELPSTVRSIKVFQPITFYNQRPDLWRTIAPMEASIVWALPEDPQYKVRLAISEYNERTSEFVGQLEVSPRTERIEIRADQNENLSTVKVLCTSSPLNLK